MSLLTGLVFIFREHLMPKMEVRLRMRELHRLPHITHMIPPWDSTSMTGIE